jgi:hypothetical protein
MSKSTLPEGEGAGTMAPLPAKHRRNEAMKDNLHLAYESYLAFCKRLRIPPMTIEWWYLLT